MVFLDNLNTMVLKFKGSKNIINSLLSSNVFVLVETICLAVLVKVLIKNSSKIKGLLKSNSLIKFLDTYFIKRKSEQVERVIQGATSSFSLRESIQEEESKDLLDENPHNIKEVVSSSSSYAVLTVNGRLYVCGKNYNGELGLGDRKNIKGLEEIPLDNIDGKISKVTLCDDHTAVLTDKGKVYIIGSNVCGQLGLGIGGNYTKKINIFEEMPLGNINGKVVDVSVGTFSTAILTDKDRVYVTGRDTKSNLGYAIFETRGVLEEIPLRNNRVFTNEVNNRVHRNIIKVTLAGGHAVAQADNGEVYICSIGERDYLYRKTLSVYTLGFLGSETERIEMVSLDLSVGGYKSIAVLTDNGKVYVYGSNQNGELGLGDYNYRDNLEEISLENIDGKVIKVEINGIHMLVLTDKGNIYACGRNDYGQLGLVDNLNRSSLEKISLENINGKIIDVSIGNNHTAVVTDQARVYICGINNSSQLVLAEMTTEIFQYKR